MWKKIDFLQAYNKAGETTMTKEKKQNIVILIYRKI